MEAERGSSGLDTTLAYVYGAACAAACDDDAAQRTTERVFDAMYDGSVARDVLAARAVRLAVRADPSPAFAAMDVPAREAVALTRLLKWDVDKVAAELAIDRNDVKALLNDGLHAIRNQLQPVTAA